MGNAGCFKEHLLFSRISSTLFSKKVKYGNWWFSVSCSIPMSQAITGHDHCTQVW